MESQAPSFEPSADLSIEDIADEIATLSATIQAATYRMLCLVEELDRRDGWADPMDANGFRSCAHWLSWRVGLSLGAARQQVRVARALPMLPRISEAFRAGAMSYSKVRAITRIAEPDNEEMLLDWALDGTASQVERLVRSYRRANPTEENERAEEQQRSRGLVTFFDDDGMLVVRGRLAPEQGALLMKALEVAEEELWAGEDGSAEPSPATDTAPATDPAPKTDAGQRRADALARVAEQSLAEDASEPARGDRFQVVVHVDAEVLADPEADGRCDLADGPVMAAQTARRLACDANVCEMHHGSEGELTAGRKTRVVSTTLRRALRARDGTRCVFPGCTCRGVDAHHVKHWAEGGATVLSNIASLCRAHHVLVHEGGFRMEALPGGRFVFLRPDGQPLVAAPPLPTVVPDPVKSLTARWLPPDVTVTPTTGLATWDGEAVDYDWAVDLLRMHSRASPDEQRVSGSC